MKNLPDFVFEREFWDKGGELVGGCDEVGRGCFAGPVVAACVVFSPDIQGVFQSSRTIINDSKRLTRLQREKADEWIRKNALTWGVGVSGVSAINKKGIIKATHLSFRRAVFEAGERIKKTKSSKKIEIEKLLIDAFYIPYVKGIRKNNQHPIVKGDAKCFSIAAASIVAKVYRDKLMTSLGLRSKYYCYGWCENKGYGTKLHREAILKYGTTKHHREMFVSTFISKRNLKAPALQTAVFK